MIAELNYLNMLEKIIAYGTVKTDRTGTGTKAIFGHELRINLNAGFPLLTTKFVSFRNVAIELLWFLTGNTNIQPLVSQGLHIWSDWPYKRFCQEAAKSGTSAAETLSLWDNRMPTMKEFEQSIIENEAFAQVFGDLGPVYGKQWRRWSTLNEEITGETIDQISKSIELLKTSPDSRRNIVSAWNAADIDEMAISGLPPCHFAFQWNTRPLSLDSRKAIYRDMTEGILIGNDELIAEWIDKCKVPKHRLDVVVNIRSWDTFLGGPYNIASYALLNHMYCRIVNMVPGEVIILSGDTHIYSNHFEQVKEQLSRTESMQPAPSLYISDRQISSIFDFKLEDFEIKNYSPMAGIRAPIAV